MDATPSLYDLDDERTIGTDGELRPDSLYGWSKAAGETLGRRIVHDDPYGPARAVFAAGIDSPQLAAEARSGLTQIAELIAVDQVVLVMPGKKDGRYTAAVYATDGGARLASVAIKVGQRDLETAFADAAEELYAQVAKVEHPRRRSPPRKGQFHVPGFVRSPWFWGAAAAVVVTSIAVPLVMAGDDPPPGCPSGSSCGQVIFRF